MLGAVEHCCSQRGSKLSFSHTAESRIGDIRRRSDRFLMYFCVWYFRVPCVVMIERVGNGRMCCVEGARFELLLLIADSGSAGSNVVDIFDGSSGRWSTAALSVARQYLAATSLPNQGLAIFAGGGGL